MSDICGIEIFWNALSGREYNLFDKFARALALAYNGIRLSGVLNRLFPSERAVCGLNSSKCFENQCPKQARSFVVSLTELKSHTDRNTKHEHIREETGCKHHLV